MRHFYPKRGLIQRAAAVTAVALAATMAPGAAVAADIFQGGRVYTLHCASCHGANGVSVMPGAPNFARSEGLLQADVMLLTAVKNGKKAMPAYIGILTDGEILDVIAYLRTLRR